jgi:hypothetical protein
MAINIPIISEFSDAGVKAAKAAFQNFQTAVGDAQGGMNKFKAGSKVALDAVAANAGTFALAAGAAIGKFVADGITAFQQLALGAGKFADATGLAVEDASRYIEAAGDIGIPVDAVEAAIGRLNKTIGADPDKVRNLGVDLVYLKDGSLDVNETFKNTIDRIKGIKDPAEKARVATQLLGKGWQTMAVMIEDGSAKLDASLKSVSDQKVISEEELRMAEDYRDAMNGLGDATEDLKVKSGQRLIPLVTMVAEGATKVLEFDAAFNELVLDIVGKGTQAEKPLSDLAGVLDEGRINAGAFKTAIQQAKNPLDELTTSASNATVAIVNADTAWRDLTEQFNEVVALDKATEALGKMEAAAAEAFATGAYDDLVTYNEKAAEFMEILAEISGQMDGISSKEIMIRFQTQGPAAALELAGYLARGAEYGGLSAADALGLAGISTGSNNVNGRFRGARALGGPVAGGSSYLVGERGPELFTPTTSGNITSNSAMGGNTITVNVNGGDPDAVVRAIQKYARQNGAIPLQTTTGARF